MENVENVEKIGYSTWNDIMKNRKIVDIQDPII